MPAVSAGFSEKLRKLRKFRTSAICPGGKFAEPPRTYGIEKARRIAEVNKSGVMPLLPVADVIRPRLLTEITRAVLVVSV